MTDWRSRGSCSGLSKGRTPEHAGGRARDARTSAACPSLQRTLRRQGRPWPRRPRHLNPPGSVRAKPRKVLTDSLRGARGPQQRIHLPGILRERTPARSRPSLLKPLARKTSPTQSGCLRQASSSPSSISASCLCGGMRSITAFSSGSLLQGLRRQRRTNCPPAPTKQRRRAELRGFAPPRCGRPSRTPARRSRKARIARPNDQSRYKPSRPAGRPP